MKFLLLALTLLLSTSQVWADAPAKPIEEMVHYDVVANPVNVNAAPGEVVVQELFSFNCGHCEHFEPSVQSWLKNKPAHVRFERIEVAFHPGWVPLSKAYYALKQLGKADALTPALFQAVHKERRPLNTPELIADFVASQGVEREAFLKAYNGFVVDADVRRAVQLARQYGVQGVPAIVVQGKYRTEGNMAGGNNQMLDVADALAAKVVAESTDKTAK
ncbi:MAG: thiol:disulfide interchange protein DsbA/DsbL [Halothiobacillaceae bacterium]|nr:thiol:disulfide interchange protein DsbA/DsbL [Halothiobacillaceae bacterium]